MNITNTADIILKIFSILVLGVTIPALIVGLIYWIKKEK
jgi:CHASE3 domain sensor protein